MRNRGITRAVRPQVYPLADYKRPHIYLPLHGPTLGTDPADRSYLRDQAGDVSTNGGTSLLTTAGQLKQIGSSTVPASIWTDNPGWFTADGTANSVFREQVSSNLTTNFPFNKFFTTGYVGLLFALWFKQPSGHRTSLAQHLFDMGSTLTAGGGWRIQKAVSTSALNLSYSSDATANRTGPASGTTDLSTAHHYAFFIDAVSGNATAYTDGLSSNVTALATPLPVANHTTNVYGAIGGSGKSTTDLFMNGGTGGAGDSAMSDFLAIRFEDDVSAEISAFVNLLATHPRGQLPRLDLWP